jgi:hypothetical protein
VRKPGPADAVRTVIARLNDDRDFATVKITVLGLALLLSAALERMWG